jgi:hypothetical protein
MIAMNLMLLLIGAAFIAIARKVARYRPKARRSARRPAAASPEPALLEAAE